MNNVLPTLFASSEQIQTKINLKILFSVGLDYPSVHIKKHIEAKSIGGSGWECAAMTYIIGASRAKRGRRGGEKDVLLVDARDHNSLFLGCLELLEDY